MFVTRTWRQRRATLLARASAGGRHRVGDRALNFAGGSTTLLTLLLSVSAAFGGPQTTALPGAGDMATRLNGATAEQGSALAVSQLEPVGLTVGGIGDFAGQRSFIVEGPRRADYQTLGIVDNAIADVPTAKAGTTSVSVKVGRFDLSADAGEASAHFGQVDDPALLPRRDVRRPQGGAPRMSAFAQAPPGEAASGDRGPNRTSGGASVLAPRLATEVPPTAARMQDQPIASTSRPAARSGPAQPDATAAIPPSRTVFVGRAGAGGADLSSRMRNDFIRQVLAQNLYFPGGMPPDIAPLLDTFALRPAAASGIAPNGSGAAGTGIVTLPLAVFPAVDEAMPGTVRIFRNVPSGVSIFAWPELMLQALKSLSGPEIVSILVASAGLFGLGQVWRRRRREP